MGRRILITGARGFVGAEVVARLSRLGHSIVALVHSDGEIIESDGAAVPSEPYRGEYPPDGEVARIAGDVTAEHLGVGREAYEQLRQTTGCVIHCAALTTFGLHPERYEAVNVGGTQRVLDFVMSDGAAPTPLVYVSTAYVAGETAGLFREEDFDRNQTHGNPYEASKFRAERAVRGAIRRGLPAVIARPGIIVGHSKTGAIRKFDTLYTVVRITTAGLVRTLPGDYGAALDIVPIDWVADGVVAAAVNVERAAGRTLHLVAGAPTALEDINAVSAEFPSFYVPRYVPRHLFDMKTLGALEARYYREVVSLYDSYFHRRTRFARASTTEIFPAPLPRSGRSLLRTIFSYALHVGYFGRR